ncbi:GNAT family N-acetyltransferase [Streptomyces noursei]|uniref:GNAT family N-acetyltransferase n=1 Tax=Streptomyces noursei TaxID=1971 RepID=UPI00045F0F97|nr:GNAT family N-acetyltransferase [Streptomyces noursei]AIA06605.1 putative acetyltransferase [Streptomyces noursei]
MSDFVIRRAELDDAPALAAMRWRFKVEEDSDEVPQEETEFIAECEGWLRARMAGPWRVWLAEVGGRPCGHVFVCLVEKVPSPYPDSEALGYVTNFYVTPEQRNRSLGKALLDEVTRYAHAHRLDTLIVWPSERSSPLYRRCGFDGPGELLEQPVACS